jgi:small subunit ribosomal protein S14
MSQFRAAKLDIGCFAKIRNIRDHTKRKVYMENEPERYALSIFTTLLPAYSNYAHRQALRYIIRNTILPQRVRAQAQLQLSQMHCYTRFTQIKNRCIMGGKGRGVFSDFRLGRVRSIRGWTWIVANTLVVSISNQCARWEPAWCKESELVVQGSVEGFM